MPSFAGARAKLATATQDLFRLSGNYSIPVEAPPPAPAPPPADTAPRSSEASIMFSLEALMKANGGSVAPKRDEPDQASEQLWSMQAATPLFGTANDQALLTTPLKLDPTPSMDSMTLPSHAPSARRWPLLAALGAGLALAVGGVWMFGSSSTEAGLGGAAPVAATHEPASGEPGATEPAAAEPAPGTSVPPEGAAPSVEPASAAPSGDAPGGPDEPSGPDGTPPAGTAETSDTPPAAAQATPAPKPEAPKTAARKPPPRAPSSRASAPFDKNAARSALSAAASAAAQCGQGGAPGKGKIQVTFAPSGKVSGAQLVEGPFGGTAAGRCALRHFRAAKVPAFSGAAVTVAKSFKIE